MLRNGNVLLTLAGCWGILFGLASGNLYRHLRVMFHRGLISMGSWAWVALLSITMFVGSLLLAGILIVRLPADYLTRESSPEKRFLGQQPALRAVFWFVKNGFGFWILMMGVIMLVTPGQGLLFIFLGLTLLDFPGKHRLIQRLLGRPSLLRIVNKIRHKSNRPPLEMPGP